MKFNKLIIAFVLILCVIFSHIQFASAFDQSKLPIYIEIGLYFGESAKSTVLLETSSGFVAGKFYGNEFISIHSLLEYDQILLRKEGYYIGKDGSFVEYTGDLGVDVGNLKLYGPYHIQIGEPFKDYLQAIAYINSFLFLEDDEKPYLVYDGSWKVYVGFYISEEQAQLRAKEMNKMYHCKTTVIFPSFPIVHVLDTLGNPLFAYHAGENIYFQSDIDKGSTGIINVEGKNYRGAITAKRFENSDMSIVNKLLIEEYLYGVVPREMPASWPREALKAQAVAARGYAVSNMGRFKEYGFDLCTTTNSQVYGGYDAEALNSNAAVDETRSKLLTYEGKIIVPYYHSNSGGHTEDSENIWSSFLPYIRGVQDDFSLDAPNSTWEAVFTVEEIKMLLEKNDIDIGDVLDIKINEVSQNGRVLSLTVYGTKGQEVMEKQRSRWVFGLKSTWFSVQLNSENYAAVKNDITSETNAILLQGKYAITAEGVKPLDNISKINIFNGGGLKETECNPKSFIFTGRGYGHGLGMSQYGAKKMAELNYNYIEILEYYFRGTKVE